MWDTVMHWRIMLLEVVGRQRGERSKDCFYKKHPKSLFCVLTDVALSVTDFKSC